MSTWLADQQSKKPLATDRGSCGVISVCGRERERRGHGFATEVRLNLDDDCLPEAEAPTATMAMTTLASTENVIDSD